MNYETYFNSLPDDVELISLPCYDISVVPDLSRFYQLKTLCFTRCRLLSELPRLPETLIHLNCSHTSLRRLPELPQRLEYLKCSFTNVRITSVPVLPRLRWFVCETNSIISLPKEINDTKYDIYNTPTFIRIELNIKKQIINRFRHLYYSLKYKEKFRGILWEKVRLPKIEKKYSPENIAELLKDVDDNDQEGFERALESL
jgi:Leucine-rich repeat (LRR) protein